jgi:hypothetical protein
LLQKRENLTVLEEFGRAAGSQGCRVAEVAGPQCRRVAVNKGQSNRVTEAQRIRVVQLLASGGEVDCEGRRLKEGRFFIYR